MQPHEHVKIHIGSVLSLPKRKQNKFTNLMQLVIMLSRSILRTPVRTPKTLQTSRRYATETPPDKKPSQTPMLVLYPYFMLKAYADLSRMAAAVATVGAAYYYLLKSRPDGNYHHASKQSGSLGQPPSTVDPVQSFPF